MCSMAVKVAAECLRLGKPWTPRHLEFRIKAGEATVMDSGGQTILWLRLMTAYAAGTVSLASTISFTLVV
jgi:hypothetical protein